MIENVDNPSISENWIFQFLRLTKYRLLRHIVLILVISVVLYNSTSEVGDPTLILAFFLFLFYTNMYILVPKFLLKNKFVLYCMSVLCIIALSVLIYRVGHYFLGYKISEDGLNIPLFSILILVLVAASSSVKLFQKWTIDKQLIFELEKSKTSAELEQLKNQINPHFLFNMLNNANVLTKRDPEKASEVLVRLSDLLRYQLYDSARNKVFLTSDIRFLEDFLNLEKIRRDNFDFLISKEGDLSGIQIPPLLFISFVENAVKHNNATKEPSYVNLFFDLRNQHLSFKCINSKPKNNPVKSSFGGLGLVNIKRRLELLFPQSHDLKIEDNFNTYSVSLTINL